MSLTIVRNDLTKVKADAIVNTANPHPTFMRFPITEIVKAALKREDVEGIVINPFGESLTLPKHILQMLMEHLSD